MKHKIMLLFIIAILALGLMSCTSTSPDDDVAPTTDRPAETQPQPSTPTDTTPSTTTPKPPVEPAKELPTEMTGFRLKNFETSMFACMDKCRDDGCKNSCYNNAKIEEAMELGDASICDEVISKAAQMACKDNVGMAGVQDEGIGECAGMSSDNARLVCEDNYWIQEAVRQKNPDLCANIVNPGQRTSCEGAASEG
ncbi:MAG: hypothetical protein ABIC95_04470 [archaeon]